MAEAKLSAEQVRALMTGAMGETDEPISCFFAPGRVNIIGEHQDYNGGHVFPAALTVGIYGALRRRKDRKVRLYSENMKTEIVVDLDTPLSYQKEWGWGNYPIGIIDYLQKEGHKIPGMDLYFDGTLPAGAGLSSSACILDLTGYMLLTELNLTPIDRTELAEMAQEVEYHFVGVKVGIMDMFAISQGRKNCGVLLDCTNMEFELVPLHWKGYELIIMNTNKKRGLVDSQFNVRKEECDKALHIIQEHRPIPGLSLATEEDLEHIADEVLLRRARHASSENRRTLDFVKALKAADINEVARLLKASHASLRYDYEVSCRELDTIVALAESLPGCVASRMTGAGFGGCAIALVKAEHVENFMIKLPVLYEKEIGVRPTLYEAHIGDGVHQL